MLFDYVVTNIIRHSSQILLTDNISMIIKMKKTFTSEISQIRIIINEIKLFAENLNCSSELLNIIHTVSDEILSNIIKYAYQKPNGIIEVECKTTNNSLFIIYTDLGIPFDPLKFKKVNTESFPIGMQGINIVKAFADNVEYCRQGNANRLTIRLNLRSK